MLIMFGFVITKYAFKLLSPFHSPLLSGPVSLFGAIVCPGLDADN
jgi:hypothetical protein